LYFFLSGAGSGVLSNFLTLRSSKDSSFFSGTG
jgi:hypothetical protein